MKVKSVHIIIILIFFLNGCKESFEPDLPVVPQGFLVVEGFINAQGPTQIKLSRTTPLNQKKLFKPEPGAAIKVEGEDNSSFALTALPNGLYSSSFSSLDPFRKYRLRIKTKDNKEYLSDFVSVKITPPIDSISWKEENGGVQIYADTHDPQNKTIYYQYDYDETWEIRSAYIANYKFENGIIRAMSPGDPQTYFCWKYDTSTNINLSSSARLTEDIIHLNPIRFIQRQDERFGIRYSILVRQYALDKPPYEFLEQMKKNTESLGTIFDPQPSALRGNIHAVADPNEIVIGYIHVTTVQEKRIFISKTQLNGRGFDINSICETRDIKNDPDTISSFIPPYLPYDAIFDLFSNAVPKPIIAYKISDAKCVDCTLRGGRNLKPSFW